MNSHLDNFLIKISGSILPNELSQKNNKLICPIIQGLNSNISEILVYGGPSWQDDTCNYIHFSPEYLRKNSSSRYPFTTVISNSYPAFSTRKFFSENVVYDEIISKITSQLINIGLYEINKKELKLEYDINHAEFPGNSLSSVLYGYEVF
jgi:hypothetical protein